MIWHSGQQIFIKILRLNELKLEISNTCNCLSLEFVHEFMGNKYEIIYWVDFDDQSKKQIERVHTVT